MTFFSFPGLVTIFQVLQLLLESRYVPCICSISCFMHIILGLPPCSKGSKKVYNFPKAIELVVEPEPAPRVSKFNLYVLCPIMGNQPSQGSLPGLCDHSYRNMCLLSPPGRINRYLKFNRIDLHPKFGICIVT